MGPDRNSDDLPEHLRGAAALGVVLDLRPGDVDSDDVSAGASWGAERTVPAELIVEIATTHSGDSAARVLHLRGAKVTGSLDFEGQKAVRPLLLRDCYLEGNLIAREATFSSLRLPGCKLAASLSAYNAKFSGSLELDDGFEATGAVSLIGARIGGQLLCGNALFAESDNPALLLDGIRVEGDVRLDGTTAHGEVRMEGATVEGRLLCMGAQLLNADGVAFTADRTVVGGSVYYAEEFLAKGEVRMLGARIGGPLVCEGGTFSNPGGYALSVDRATISGGVFLTGDFSAEGTVRLPGCQLGSQLVCAKGKIVGSDGVAMTLDTASVKDGVLWDEGFVVEGLVRIQGARIEGPFYADKVEFKNSDGVALAMIGAEIQGNAFCRPNFSTDGQLCLRGARVKGQLSFEGGSTATGLALDLEGLEVTRDLCLEPKESLSGSIDLTNAKAGDLRDNTNAWTGGYELRGFRYDSPRGAYEALSPGPWYKRDRVMSARLDWLKANGSGYQPQIYDQLAQACKNAGEDSRRRRALIAKQRRRRSRSKWPGKAWSVAQDLLVGFGYRTWLALVPFALLLVSGLIFFAGNREDITPKNPDLHGPDLQILTYTLDLLVPVVNLGQRENFAAHHTAQTVSTVLVIAGWVLTTAILAALTGMVRRSD